MKYVLITGASGGIGLELASVFAREGWGLLLTSSSMERLEEAGQKLSARSALEMRTYVQDLSRPGAAGELYRQVARDGICPHALVNNAGFGLAGGLEEMDVLKLESMLLVNVLALTELTRLFLPDFYRRGNGKILNVSSTGAFQPGPYSAAYFASKAYVLSFSRGVRYEAKKRGVTVSTLCPGATKTGFFQKEGKAAPLWAMTAEAVAASAYEGLMHGRDIIVPGMRNRLMNLFPQWVKTRAAARIKA